MNQDPHTSLPAFIVLSRDDITIRAYQLYLERGQGDGFANDDWFRAEHELKARGKEAERRRDS